MRNPHDVIEDMRMIVTPGEYGLGAEPESHVNSEKEAWEKLGSLLDELQDSVIAANAKAWTLGHQDRIDLEPGRYSSEHGKWYFSCDSGESVLVGIRGEDGDLLRGRIRAEGVVQWTCPILGLERMPITERQLVELDTQSAVVWGDPDEGIAIRMINRLEWNEILSSGPGVVDRTVPEDEWGNRSENVVFLTTDAEEVVRLHLSFE